MTTTKEQLYELIKRDNEIKESQQKLNKEISEFIAKTTGLQGPATLLDIMMAMETKNDPPRIITP